MLMDVHQRGNLRFPQSLPEFQRLFPDDAACAGYLEKARWSDGFVCPHCQAAGEPFRFANRPGVLRCRRCRRDTPLSSASTGGSIRSTPSVPCSASRATSPHRPTQSFTPEPGSTLHVGGVGNNRIGKVGSTANRILVRVPELSFGSRSVRLNRMVYWRAMKAQRGRSTSTPMTPSPLGSTSVASAPRMLTRSCAMDISFTQFKLAAKP